MAVNFTPNIGLAKPTEPELAKNWVTVQDLIQDNNDIIVDKTDIDLTATTPTWIGPTTNPSVGAGTIQLEYNKVRDMIMGEFAVICVDPGVASGTGIGGFGIRLPELADLTFHTAGTALLDAIGIPSVIGSGHFTDASSVDGSMTLVYDLIAIAGVHYLRPLTEAYTGKTQRWIGPSLPVAMATGDKITGNFIYKAA